MEMSRKKRRRRRLLLIVPLLVLTGLVLLVELHLSPYIRELARNQAVNAASNAIIEAVSEMLRRGDTDFSRVIVLEKDVEGHITALRTDMTQVERLKVEVLEILDTLVAQINTQQMGIPLGNLLLPDLLAGTGPVLPVKAVSLTMSNADFFSDFTEAGINQTLQTLKVKFTISLTMSNMIGLKGWAAGIVGGFGYIPGTILGGLLIGVVESLAILVIPTVYKDIVAFVFLIVVLLIRPGGFMRHKV